MKIGLQALGIGSGARPAIIRAVATAAEQAGFATLWVGEHVVLFDSHDSKYPYAESGKFPVGGAVDWLDPFAALTYAAAVTSSIRLATGICLVPEHNPLRLAKQAASLDFLSGGRFALGAGIGWMAEEFAALGIPFAGRARRSAEYIAAIRRLWTGEPATFSGEFVNFSGARSCPKPTRSGGIPVIIGGESTAALTRAAEYGDGWFGFNLEAATAAEKIALLRSLMAARGRGSDAFEIVVAPFNRAVAEDDLDRYRTAGVDELVVVAEPPAEAASVERWITDLAQRWITAD